APRERVHGACARLCRAGKWPRARRGVEWMSRSRSCAQADVFRAGVVATSTICGLVRKLRVLEDRSSVPNAGDFDASHTFKRLNRSPRENLLHLARGEEAPGRSVGGPA